MTAQLCDCLALAFICGTVGFVYAVPLTEPGHILSWWYKMWDSLIGEYDWLMKPIVECERCVSGQFALWTFLAIHWGEYSLQNWTLVMYHIFTICTAVYISIIHNSLYQWLKKIN